jgi:hypothetical protein
VLQHHIHIHLCVFYNSLFFVDSFFEFGLGYAGLCLSSVLIAGFLLASLAVIRQSPREARFYLSP